MTEVPGKGDPKPPQQTRLEHLRKELPIDLLTQMSEEGITRDYVNMFTGALTLAEALRHPAASPALTYLAREEFMEIVRGVKTYSEYWRERIVQYNTSIVKKGEQAVAPGKAFDLLVTTQPKASELDEIAMQARDLADIEEDPEDIAAPFIRLCVEALVIIDTQDGARRGREILERNDL